MVGPRSAVAYAHDWPAARTSLGVVVKALFKAGLLSEADTITVLTDITHAPEPKRTGVGGWTLDGRPHWRFWIRMPLGLPPV